MALVKTWSSTYEDGGGRRIAVPVSALVADVVDAGHQDQRRSLYSLVLKKWLSSREEGLKVWY